MLVSITTMGRWVFVLVNMGRELGPDNGQADLGNQHHPSTPINDYSHARID